MSEKRTPSHQRTSGPIRATPLVGPSPLGGSKPWTTRRMEGNHTVTSALGWGLEGPRPPRLALRAGYITAPRRKNHVRSWSVVQTPERQTSAGRPGRVAGRGRTPAHRDSVVDRGQSLRVRAGPRVVAAKARCGTARTSSDLHHDPAPPRGSAERARPPA